MTRVESVDVCIVGSGAGGSVVADACARAGLDTLLLERGPRVEPSDMNHSELEMIPRLYKDGGMQLNSSMDLFILQGSLVGGSTVLSNMVMLQPEPQVFDAWSRYGAEFSLEQLGPHFDTVATELEVDYAPAANISPVTRLVARAAERLGMRPDWMRKALGNCGGCGYCNVGCTFGEKRDASMTYVRWAEQKGARVLANAEVERVRHRNGLAKALDVRIGRSRERMRVEARVVVVAAGAIGSSALLLRSGITDNVGTRVSFNAGGMMVAEFEQPLDGYDADQMTVSVPGPGFVIEVTHNPPMSAALTTPGWLRQHSALMARSRHLAYAGPLVGTEATGQVVLSRLFGHEQTRFRMSERDLARLKQGLRAIAALFFEAGAQRVYLPTHRFCMLSSAAELDQIDHAFSGMHEVSLGSAHPQGGNPISSDPRLGAVDQSLRVHGFDNLFVCDASVFPSCIGVNPIHTIMAVAKHAAGAITAQA